MPAMADEGMWTFDNFPAAAVKRDYGVDIKAEWLDRVRLSTLRLSNCTASFVSPASMKEVSGRWTVTASSAA